LPRPLVLVVALLALLPPSLLASAQDATPTATADAGVGGLARTDARYFLPYGPGGLNAGLAVTANESGVCAHGSLATPGRPDAWDCLGADDNTVRDPCFADPFAAPGAPHELACAAAPWAADVVLLRLTEPLSRAKDGAPAAAGVEEADPGPWELPWALELANGERCTLLTGASVVLAGERLHYGCEGEGWVLGGPDRAEAVWTVSYLAGGAVATTLVDVSVAWA
jgi:hypothetical protein